jgi:hypothetical protein
LDLSAERSLHGAVQGRVDVTFPELAGQLVDELDLASVGVGAAGRADVVFDRLDDLVAVARLLGDETENDRTKVAVSKQAAKAGPTAAVAARRALLVVQALGSMLPAA